MSRPNNNSEDPRRALDLTRLYELSRDILCAMTSDGCLERLSPAITDVLGWSPDALVGRAFLDLVHPDDRDAVADELARAPQHGDCLEFETRYRAKDETYVPLSWTVRADPETGRLYAAGRDLRVIQHLRQRLEKAEMADSAGTAKTEFLASMNHELRTPLNAILGYTELLASDSTLAPNHREALDSIRRSGEHLLLLISDILDFAKLDSRKLALNPREFLLPNFLQTITELFEGRARQKNIAFIHQQTSSLPAAICCDETRLRQVLLNLLSNAIKFTKVGGVILKTGYDGKKLRFQIEDTGIGIPQSHIEAIFRPFEQIPQDHSFVEGTGLGLSISSRLVRLMGGELHVKSDLGKGSTFWFEIEPEVATNWQNPPKAPPVLVGYEGPTKKLLIVDDKKENRELMSQTLRAAGFETIEAANGREAIELATKEHPDLIFMDLVMPSLDGFEAIRRIRDISALKSVPIIASSASLFGDDDGDSPGQGYDSFLQKPVELETMFELLSQHLDLTWRYNVTGTAGAAGASVEVQPLAQASEPEIALSPDQLQAIYDAAIIGDIREILVILEEAGITGDTIGQETTPTLGVELYFLAKGFQGKQIKEKLRPYLE